MSWRGLSAIPGGPVRLEKACRQRRLFDGKRAVARIDVGQFDEAVGDVASSSTGGLLHRLMDRAQTGGKS
jgi:hypothetical protein